jgi:hypothetical protein
VAENGTSPVLEESQQLSEQLRPLIARLERVVSELEQIALQEEEDERRRGR